VVLVLLAGCNADEHAPPLQEAEAGRADAASVVDTFVIDADADDDVAVTDSGAPDTRFASYPPWPDADVDAWLGGPSDAGACDDSAADAASGTRFCDLYRDLFAHAGVAKCQTYGCHGGERGMQGLAMGWTAKSMYDAMVAFKTWIEPKTLLTPVPGGDSRPVSALSKSVGPADGYFMPFVVDELGNRKLTADEVARIDAWLARGAPFD